MDYTILDEDEIRRLFVLMRAEDTSDPVREACADALVRTVIPFVIKKIKSMRPRSKYFDDYFSESMTGVSRSLTLFDLDREVKWITYVGNVVFGRVICVDRHERNLIRVPSMAKDRKEILNQLKRIASITEYPYLTGRVDVDRLVMMERMELVREAMSALNERQRTTIDLRLKGLTFQEIGDHFGVTRQRAEQIEHVALRVLKQRVKEICNAKDIVFDSDGPIGSLGSF